MPAPRELQETLVLSLGREGPLEEEMAAQSSTVAWEIPWTEEPDGYSPWSWTESDTTERLSMHTHIDTSVCIYLHTVYIPIYHITKVAVTFFPHCFPVKSESFSCSVMADSLGPHGL